MDEAIELEQTPEFYWDRGNVYMKIKNFKKAIIDFKISLEMKPKSASFCHSIGLGYQALEKWFKALSFFKQALEFDEKHLASLFHMGLMYQKIV